MRIVDFHTFPDGSKQRTALVEAVEGLELGGLETTTTPIADDAPAAIGFPDDWTDDDIEVRATEIQEELAASIGDDAAVRFELADADVDRENEDAGSPNRAE